MPKAFRQLLRSRILRLTFILLSFFFLINLSMSKFSDNIHEVQVDAGTPAGYEVSEIKNAKSSSQRKNTGENADIADDSGSKNIRPLRTPKTDRISDVSRFEAAKSGRASAACKIEF